MSSLYVQSFVYDALNDLARLLHRHTSWSWSHINLHKHNRNGAFPFTFSVNCFVLSLRARNLQSILWIILVVQNDRIQTGPSGFSKICNSTEYPWGLCRSSSSGKLAWFSWKRIKPLTKAISMRWKNKVFHHRKYLRITLLVPMSWCERSTPFCTYCTYQWSWAGQLLH